MTPPKSVRDEYQAPLRSHNLEVPDDRVLPDWVQDTITNEMVSSSLLQGEPETASYFQQEMPRLDPRYRRGGMQACIDDIAEQVEQRVAKSGVVLKRPVLVGEFPTGDYNACVVQARDGFIVLLNSGLMFTLWHVAKILAYHVDLGEIGSDGALQVQQDNAHWNKATTPSAIAKVLFCYMNFVDSRLAPR